MKRILSFLLAAVMIFTLTPLVYAAEVYTPESYREISRKTSTLAPGVTQDVVYTKLTSNSEQMVYYLATIDMNHRDANGKQDVHIYSSYKDATCGEGKWGMSMLTDQIKAAQSLHGDPNDKENYIPYYNVVGGINASFYNMSNGQPSGAFAMGGTIVTKATGSFFAVRKDGSAVIGYAASDWDKYNTADNPIVEAVGGGRVQIQDGVLKQSGTGDLNARTSIGLTADGKVVMAVSDGKQSPYSAGTDMKHMGEILLEAGCVSAIELDGGGSTTYAARQEGANEITLVAKPCDGSERAISSGLIFVSTTPPSDVFARAALTPEHDYVTPGSTVSVSATGVSPAGTAADIPDDITWQLADSSLGTVSGGVFTSTGETGDAEVQMVHEGKVVGMTTIHVVVPNRLEFDLPAVALPYGESTAVNVTAKYGENDVYYNPKQVTLTLSDSALGTLNGFEFTACENKAGAPSSGKITAAYGDLTEEIAISLGKGSEVIYTFEDGVTPDDLQWEPNGSNAKPYLSYATEMKVVDAANGRVHNGNYALALCGDWSNCTNSNCTALQVRLLPADRLIDLTGAIKVGAWIWIPDEYSEYRIRFITRKTGGSDAASTNFERPLPSELEEGGHWIYVCQDISTLDDGRNLSGVFLQFEFFAPNSDSMKAVNQMSVCNKLTFYVDDITIDYSSVIPDRKNPVFSAINLHPNADSSVALPGKTVTPCESGTMTFSAAVADDTTASFYSGNSSGIDPSSAKAFVDGQRISVTYQNGTMRTEEVTLAAGVHTLTLGIADNTGNYVSVIRKFSVSANADIPTVRVEAHDPAATKLPLGSLYYVDVVATDIAAIDGVDLKLDLNNISEWELDHADVDSHFTMTHSVQSLTQGDNIATITLKRKTDSDGAENRTGEVVLASLPIRVWKGNDEWFSKSVFQAPRDVSVEVDYGKITYSAGYKQNVFPAFSSARIQAVTEMDVWGAAVANSKWHSHDPKALEAGAATCTEPGYTNRTFCEGCNSVVAWGEEVEALGHLWNTNSFCMTHLSNADLNGKAHCDRCEILLTGDYTNPTYGFVFTYVNGVLANGWYGESWYVSGSKKTGYYMIKDGDGEDAEELLFYLGEDGVCPGKKPFTGERTETLEDGSEKITLWRDGKLANGWVDDCYYTDGVKQTEEFYEIAGKMYRFEDGVCKGQEPYTGFREAAESRYYYEFGFLVTGKMVTDNDGNEVYDGWFQVEEEYCHACEGKGGALGKVTNNDNRTCVQAGYIFYNCSCGVTKMSEALWDKGHKWKSDTERVCDVCEKQAKDISKASVSFTNSPYFLYTGSEIRPELTVTDGDNKLIVESDRRGRDGLATFSNNTNVGRATVSIEGRGDYDEKTVLTANFYIIPADVPALRAQAKGADSVLLDWDAAPGATYYAIYQRLEGEGEDAWKQIAAVRTLSYTVEGLEQGNTYQFRIGSRAEVAGEKDPYVSANWTETEITLEHEWGEPFEEIKGSCTTDGSYKHTCKVCGKEEEVTVPAPGHDVEEWTIKEPTIREPGIKTGVCAVCREDVTQEIEKLPSYAINISQVTNGSVSAEPDDIAAAGDSVTVSAEPGSGYKLDKLSVTYTDEDGTHELEVKDGVFTMPPADVTVSASFVRISTGGGGGSGGGGGTSSGSTPPSTTTNGDGSTTKTETKTDGTTVETTTKTDGSKIETETKPDGTKTTTETDAKGNESTTVEKSDGSKSVEVKQADGTTASATVTSDGKTEAEVKLSDTAVKQAAGSSIVLPIPEVKVDHGSGGASATVKVSVPQSVQSDKPVRVTVPVAEIKSGDVAVIVNPDGSETVVKKSTVTEDGISIPLEEGATIKIVDNSKEFKDTGSHWSHDAVSFVTSRELFNGVSEDSFAPNESMNRAMLVTVLHRLEDTPAGGQVKFPDVKGDTWYSDAVAWASEKNIVTGYQNGSFGPNDRITREQIAVILYRYAATQDVDTSKLGSLTAFADGASTASWAQEGMSWAVGAGLFQGSNGRLEPQKSATRAEVAVILQRFVEYMAS